MRDPTAPALESASFKHGACAQMQVHPAMKPQTSMHVEGLIFLTVVGKARGACRSDHMERILYCELFEAVFSWVLPSRVPRSRTDETTWGKNTVIC